MNKDIKKFNKAVFQRALLLGGTVTMEGEHPVVQVPEHAIEEFKRWMAKEKPCL